MPLRPWRGALARALALSVLSACSADRAISPAAPAPAPGPHAEGDAPAAVAPLVITELMADPQRVADAAGEWLEIYNGGETPVDLSGWRINSFQTESHVIAGSLVVPARGFVVLGNNANSATNGGVTVDYSWGTSITLNNSNTDWVTLRTPDGQLVDSVAYAERTNGTPGSYAPTAGVSRVVVSASADNTIIAGNANWVLTPVGTTYGLGDRGTPGSGSYGPVSPAPAGPIAAITVDSATVAVGATRQLAATLTDSAGAPTTGAVGWTSGDPTVATVDAASGLATGVKEGTTTVTATAANGVAGSATLRVVAAGSAASVTLAVNDPAQVPVGFTKPAFPTARDANGAILTPPPAYVWTSSAPGVATVDSLGYITGVAPGTATVRATAPSGAFGQVTFTVVPATAPTGALYRNHLEFGTPTDATPGDEILLAKAQYALSYNAARGGPNWVSWNLNASQFGGAPRCDCFSADLALPNGVSRVVDFDYRNGGYDRGHMVQSESRTTTDQENAATFLLTNILPQAAENNQGPWVQLENYLNDLVRTGGKEVYVVAGGEYAPNAPTLKNEGRVAIPSYTWKVAVVVGAGQGLAGVTSPRSLQVIAVRMPNLVTAGGPASAVGIRDTPWQTFQTSVDAIEAATGYDLLSALPDDVERDVEAPNAAPQVLTLRPEPATGAFTLTTKACGGRYTACVRFALADADGAGDAPFATVVNWGDGTAWSPNTIPGAGIPLLAPHDYTAAGSYTVTVTATDRRGAVGTQTLRVTVAP